MLRGARRSDGQVKLVAAYDQTDGVVLGQVAVEGGDEIAALPAVLDTVGDLADVLVTADALHCVRHEVARERVVTRKGGRLMLPTA